MSAITPSQLATAEAADAIDAATVAADGGFADYTDRELLIAIAERVNAQAVMLIDVLGQAPEMFDKFSNPMVKLAIGMLIK